MLNLFGGHLASGRGLQKSGSVNSVIDNTSKRTNPFKVLGQFLRSFSSGHESSTSQQGGSGNKARKTEVEELREDHPIIRMRNRKSDSSSYGQQKINEKPDRIKKRVSNRVDEASIVMRAVPVRPYLGPSVQQNHYYDGKYFDGSEIKNSPQLEVSYEDIKKTSKTNGRYNVVEPIGGAVLKDKQHEAPGDSVSADEVSLTHDLRHISFGSEGEPSFRAYLDSGSRSVDDLPPRATLLQDDDGKDFAFQTHLPDTKTETT